MPEDAQWVNLHNPSQGAWHRVPNNPVVIQDFQDRGWETPEDSAARAKAEAIDLHGLELEEALESEGLPKSGTVKEKQKRLAEKRAESITVVGENGPELNAPIEENEGEQVHG